MAKMAWMFTTVVDDRHAPHIRQSVFELDDQSDRAAAIVGASILDTILTAALKNPSVRSFKQKIDLAREVALIDEEFHSDLITIRNIRNRFAHDLSISDFNSQTIKDLCLNLKTCETHTYDVDERKKLPPKDRPELPMFSLGLKDRKSILKNPRHRFLLAAQVLTMQLSLPKEPNQQVGLIF